MHDYKLPEEGKIHPISCILDQFKGSLELSTTFADLNLKLGYEPTEYVEWILAHRGCGKPLTGSSPRNGWCMCSPITGLPPQVAPSAPTEVHAGADPDALKAAEEKIAKLTEKLDRASKRIAELSKKGGDQ